MRKNIEMNEEQYAEFINKFYGSFETGYVFEEFLKTYLEKIGFDEVMITAKSRDGGVDLKATRKGIGDFSDADRVDYYVQAKRYKPDTIISVKTIRELKGTIPFGNKGMLITTAKFSKDAMNEAMNDQSKQVVLVDGRKLIESCIDNEIGFVFVPSFSEFGLKKLLNQDDDFGELNRAEDSINAEIAIDKTITSNDIRARIISVPRDILKTIPENVDKIEVTINGTDIKTVSVRRDRSYLAGVTDIFKKYGLMQEDGTYCPMKAKWVYSDGKINIYLK